MAVPNIFQVQLTRGMNTRRFLVGSADGGGWELRDEMNDRTVHLTHYQDWHRVERAVAFISRTVERLQEEGWTLRHPSPEPEHTH